MPKAFSSVLYFLTALLVVTVPVLAQAPAPPAAAGAKTLQVIGDVVAVDADSRLMTVKDAKTGESFTFVFDETSQYLQVPPGAKTLDGATPVALADINRGDKVFGRGAALEDGHTIPVRKLLVMSKASIEKKNSAELEDWQKRGVVGTIIEVKPKTREIVVQTSARRGGGFRGQGAPGAAGTAAAPGSGARGAPPAAGGPDGAAGSRAGGPGGFGPSMITLQASDNTVFRRYAGESMKYGDSKESTFVDLKEGDQLRALGERSEDGSTYKVEKIVSGSFRIIAGTVTAVDPQSGEVKVTTVPGRQVVSVAINKDSVLRHFPPQFAQMMAARIMGGMHGAGGPGAAGGPGGSAGAPGPGAAGFAGERPAGAPAAGGPGGAGAGAGGPGAGMNGGGFRRGGGGSEDLLERLPPVTLAELKAGDAVMVFSPAGKNVAKATAIAFVSGVEPFLAAFSIPQMPRGVGGGGGAVSLGLPGSALDLGGGMSAP